MTTTPAREADPIAVLAAWPARHAQLVAGREQLRSNIHAAGVELREQVADFRRDAGQAAEEVVQAHRELTAVRAAALQAREAAVAERHRAIAAADEQYFATGTRPDIGPFVEPEVPDEPPPLPDDVAGMGSVHGLLAIDGIEPTTTWVTRAIAGYPVDDVPSAPIVRPADYQSFPQLAAESAARSAAIAATSAAATR